MSYHDNELVLGYLFEYFHDLNACCRIESTCRLICKKNIRIVHKCSCDGNTLHLTARHLVRLFVKLISETDLFKCVHSTLPSLGLGYARKRQCKLNICQNILMRDKIIALENKADRVISVAVPIAVLEILGGFSVDDKVAACVLVKTADDIQHSCFSAARLTEY